MDKWFDIDKEGLAKLLAHKGKVFLLHELIQNAWDTNCKEVTVSLQPVPGQPRCDLTVVDDDPDGFQDISHAYTLFSESAKKTDPTKRGRFNFGEKIVLALCEQARITSTKGAVEFLPDGTRKNSRERTTCGSLFQAVVRITRAEYDEVCAEINRLIPPAGCETWFNGSQLLAPALLREWEDTLATEVADESGTLRPTRRKTTVRLYTMHPTLPITDQPSGWLYEMGIPVVEIGTPFHVDVQQKVPLNLQRDNVRPAYLRDLRVSILNHAADLVPNEQSAAVWVGDALSDKEITPQAVRTVIEKRYGDKVVAGDPSDPEAMRTATANGYTVISGRAFTKEQWENIRAASALPPAGKVFPTVKPYSTDPNAPPVEVIPDEEWSCEMRDVAQLVFRLGQDLMGVRVRVRYVKQMGGGCVAAYGNQTLDFNLGRLGRAFFNWREHREELLDLLIHEFGHQYCGNHLDADYHRALTRLGAKLALLVRTHPHLLD